jgi:RHS repeat-associated protein
VQKKVYSYTSSAFSLQSIHLFVYNGWNLIEEQVSGIHNPVSRYYVWGLDLSQSLEGAGGVGGLLSVVDSGETYHYLYDSNGNVGQLVKTSDGSISAHYEYNPFGILLESSGVLANENPFRFSTKYYDNETDLCYYGYRYYSPELGRWINRDPSGEEGGINLYSFIRNDPI